MATQNVNTKAEPTGVCLDPSRVALLKDSCSEIEQITRLLGTSSVNVDNDLVVRGLVLRLHELNSVVYWALVDDGSFDMEKSARTVRGPKAWGIAA